jgi:hypothetical protein
MLEIYEANRNNHLPTQRSTFLCDSLGNRKPLSHLLSVKRKVSPRPSIQLLTTPEMGTGHCRNRKSPRQWYSCQRRLLPRPSKNVELCTIESAASQTPQKTNPKSLKWKSSNVCREGRHSNEGREHERSQKSRRAFKNVHLNASKGAFGESLRGALGSGCRDKFFAVSPTLSIFHTPDYAPQFGFSFLHLPGKSFLQEAYKSCPSISLHRSMT